MLSKITNLIGWVGVALVFGAFALRFLRPEEMSLWWNLAAAGLVCVLIYVIGQWREFVTFFSGRSARYGTFSVISVIVVLAILIGLNYIAGRQHKRWDLTSNQQFTLSEQTTKILNGLKEPLTMIAFEAHRRGCPRCAIACGLHRRLDAGEDRRHRSRQGAAGRAQVRSSGLRHRRPRAQGPHRARHGV